VLGSFPSYPELHTGLQSLPSTLDETYSRILKSIPSNHIQHAVTMLRLLTWSQRPLRLDEIVDAIAVDLKASPTFDPRNRIPHPRDFLRLYQGLVVLSPVVEDQDDEAKDQNWQIQLAHVSVRQFLLSGRVTDILGLRMDQSFANAQIAKICLAYLSNTTAHSLSLENARLQQNTFALYSARYWSDHTRLAGITDHVSSDVVSALQAASSKGHDGVVQILLDGGADINAQGGEYGNALDAASANGHITTLKMLVHNGADVNARSGRHGTALHAALLSGSSEVVQTLLETGADVNAKDADSRTVLYGASQEGLDQIVLILLEHGAEPNALGGEYGTALQVAALNGRREIVRMLMLHGADAGQSARASDHQEGYSNVAYSEFYDSGYSSRPPQSAIDKHKGTGSRLVSDDTESIGSVETDIQSSTESVALSNVREAAAREVAKAFTGDREISQLYDEGLKRLDASGFIKDHRRLLKLFYLEAAKDAEDASHHIVLRFLRSRIARIRISAWIVKGTSPPYEEPELGVNRGQSLRLINGILTRADKARDTSRWTEAQSDPTLVDASSTFETNEMNDDDDFDDFDISNEEEGGLRVDDLPALVDTTAFLLDGRAFQIYKSNLQRLAFGKRIAPTAFRSALVVDDLALAIELLENEEEAVTQSGLGFEWIKEPLAMGFTPAEVVRLVIEKEECSFWLVKSSKAIGVGRWERAHELIRGDHTKASYRRVFTEHLSVTDRQANNFPEQHHDIPSRLEHKRHLFDTIPWKESSRYLKTRTHAMCLGVWKQGRSRISETIVQSGLILGLLEPGYTRITWKTVSSAL
jgi:hypothetical protein